MKAYKIIFTIVAMVMFAQMMAINAYAYIDVSATSYIIQIVAGIVVAVGAVIGVVISKVKKRQRTSSASTLTTRSRRTTL